MVGPVLESGSFKFDVFLSYSWGFIMLEERLLVCRLFTGLTLELVPMVSIQVPAEILSVQQIFPLSLLPWQAPWEKAQCGTM